MRLLGFKTILHKKCRSGKNSEGPAENSWVLMSSKMKTNFKKSVIVWNKSWECSSLSNRVGREIPVAGIPSGNYRAQAGNTGKYDF